MKAKATPESPATEEGPQHPEVHSERYAYTVITTAGPVEVTMAEDTPAKAWAEVMRRLGGSVLALFSQSGADPAGIGAAQALASMPEVALLASVDFPEATIRWSIMGAIEAGWAEEEPGDPFVVVAPSKEAPPKERGRNQAPASKGGGRAW